MKANRLFPLIAMILVTNVSLSAVNGDLQNFPKTNSYGSQLQDMNTPTAPNPFLLPNEANAKSPPNPFLPVDDEPLANASIIPNPFSPSISLNPFLLPGDRQLANASIIPNPFSPSSTLNPFSSLDDRQLANASIIPNPFSPSNTPNPFSSFDDRQLAKDSIFQKHSLSRRDADTQCMSPQPQNGNKDTFSVKEGIYFENCIFSGSVTINCDRRVEKEGESEEIIPKTSENTRKKTDKGRRRRKK
ncbi:MAG: hypothetical protein LBI95_04135 [Holosporales bacterium]|jgi:hypothetical protein|nr:hypothetical protein [Holosporales bacterium]